MLAAFLRCDRSGEGLVRAGGRAYVHCSTEPEQPQCACAF